MTRKLIYEFSHLANKLMNSEVREVYKTMSKLDKLAVDEHATIQSEYIQSLFQYCGAHVPYYRKTFNDHGINVSAIREWDDLKKIPVLTKEILRAQKANLISERVQEYNTGKRRSGGTTGEPMEILVDRKCQAFETFCYFRGLQWMGYTPGTRIIKFWGGSLNSDKVSVKGKLRSFAMNQSLIPAFDINTDTASGFLDEIKKSGRCVFIGYPSAIYNLALLSIKLNRKFTNIQLAATTAEVLNPEWAEVIREAFNCPVKAYYGCSEVEALGYQVDENGSYIVPGDVNLIESVNTGKPIKSLLATSLHNRAMPLIRYENGDSGVVKFNKDDHFRIEISDLVGRSDDFFITEKGEFVTGRLGAKLISMCNLDVLRFQLIQHEIHQFEFRYSSDHGELNEAYTKHMNVEMKAIFGEKVNVKYNLTEEFLLSSSNKLRTSICLCHN